MKKPVFKGNGNHSIRDLERLCNEYEEFCHQRQIERQQIEQRNKEQVEVLEKELSFLNSIEGFFSKDFEVKLQYRIRSIKEQLKKSGEL